MQRLYLEETLLASEVKDDSRMSKEVLRLVEQRGRVISEAHGDFTVLASCWETMFFSTRFDMQQRASTFLKENVKVSVLLNGEFETLLYNAANFPCRLRTISTPITSWVGPTGQATSPCSGN